MDKQLSTLTTEEMQHWREGLHEFDAQNELIALSIMCAFGKPVSWLDVGCGTGALIKCVAENRVRDAIGIDQLIEFKKVSELTFDDTCLMRHDLRQPLDLGRTFDLVTSIEVVEHIEEQYEGVICDTLVRHVAGNGRLILTAAKPGQVGYNHFNCQPQSYWRDRMQSRGLRYSRLDTLRLIEIWKLTNTVTDYLEENLQVFTR